MKTPHATVLAASHFEAAQETVRARHSRRPPTASPVAPVGRPRSAEWVARAYRRFGPAIYARSRRMLGDKDRAEDATQEVFVRVIEHLETAPDDEAALWWVKTITRNHCLNLLRQGAREAEPVGELPEPEPERPDAASDFADRQQVSNLLRRVPKRLREPASLFYLRDLSQDAIAKKLGVSRRTVLLRLAEFKNVARRLLRQDDIALKGQR